MRVDRSDGRLFSFGMREIDREAVRALWVQFVQFCAVGGVATLAQYVVLLALTILLKVEPVFASATGFVIGAVVSYALNRTWTFKCSKRHIETLTKFMVSAFVGCALNTSLMWLGTSCAGIQYMAAQVGATGIVLIWNFLINRYWTFHQWGVRGIQG